MTLKEYSELNSEEFNPRTTPSLAMFAILFTFKQMSRSVWTHHCKCQ
jgi:hypothetical protein